ncbi:MULTISPECIES: energy transducer TonB [Aequorivita]|uniref:Energy transducer TonB n=2 Tax=Aequorivita TaxID=153265 RepID=A0AB35YPJ8_9FLAO|nr:energy transducer TonB [Aequorivita sp. Ant34-E75]WGF93120.1 energy transducer TonB [Aequorivita sp. Ant34-E75]
MFKKIFTILIIISSAFSFAQSEEVSESHATNDNVPFAVIEKVPVYPDCDFNTNLELKKCMSTKISEFVSMHFNLSKIEALNLPPNVYRVSVQFKIDKEGNVVGVRARAAHPEIEAEAVRVVSNLPQMEPGKQKGEAVGVLYSLPIVFKIEPPTQNEKKKKKRKRKN